MLNYLLAEFYYTKYAYVWWRLKAIAFNIKFNPSWEDTRAQFAEFLVDIEQILDTEAEQRL